MHEWANIKRRKKMQPKAQVKEWWEQNTKLKYEKTDKY